jgi:hypothetical protein
MVARGPPPGCTGGDGCPRYQAGPSGILVVDSHRHRKRSRPLVLAPRARCTAPALVRPVVREGVATREYRLQAIASSWPRCSQSSAPPNWCCAAHAASIAVRVRRVAAVLGPGQRWDDEHPAQKPDHPDDAREPGTSATAARAWRRCDDWPLPGALPVPRQIGTEPAAACSAARIQSVTTRLGARSWRARGWREHSLAGVHTAVRFILTGNAECGRGSLAPSTQAR